ncbi:MAG TPA: histidine kinase [Gaiella sp.]
MKPLRLALLVLGVALAIVDYGLLRDDLHQTVLRSLPAPAVGLSGIVAGLVAWSRRPDNRLGPLMVAFGFAWLIRPWQYSESGLAFTVSFALGWLGAALFAHIALAYPTGRVTDRWERLLVRAGYVVALAFPTVTLLFYDGSADVKYVRPEVPSGILVHANDTVVEILDKGFVLVMWGVLAPCFVALVIRKLVRATPRARRVLLPILLAALIASLRAFYEFLLTFLTPPASPLAPPPELADNLYWWQVIGQIALPLALLAGLLSARLAVAHVGDLMRTLDRVPPRELRPALAQAVGDPSLEIAFWLPERHGYADADGRPVTLPADGPRRAVTHLADDDGAPLAAIVHDPSLHDEPELIEAAGAAARLALENARLEAELKAQLARVQESRVRIVAAGDEQRRRIERDIHDGAQQRLVALALELRAAQKRLGTDAPPELDQVLAGAVDELQLAVGELRELARGVHPAILTEDGLAAALESLADRTPLPVRILAAPEARLPAPIEGAAYFVACEALANAVKHAGATSITIRAEQHNGSLVVEVADDGIGGASIGGGSGLRGLADRIEAHGGRLRVESPVGGGTHVIGELPCAS